MKKSKKLLAVLTIMLLIVCMAVPVSAASKINKKKQKRKALLQLPQRLVKRNIPVKLL